MSRLDRRPGWMLRKHARISSARLERTGVRPELLTFDVWWQQIAEAAAELGLEVGTSSDWQAWLDAPPVEQFEDPLQ